MRCKQEKATVNELHPPQTQYPLETTTDSWAERVKKIGIK